MKKVVLMALMAVGIVTSASAQRDDLYFIPKKKKVVTAQVAEMPVVVDEQAAAIKTFSVNSTPVKQLEMDTDAYNRRGSYFTEEADTILLDDDSQLLTSVGEGWVNGFEGSDSDYEYAMRIIRFRNPRYAIPVSSPLYWDVVYGGTLWTSWEWNVYDDGMYAYVFPTWSNRYYWDYMAGPSYSFSFHWGYPYGYHWGSHYGWACHSPIWYNPGWHHGHHHGFYPGISRPGWGVSGPKVIQNRRTPGSLPSHRGVQAGSSPSRVGSSARVVAGRTGGTSTSVSRPSGTAMRSSGSSHTGSNQVVRRSTGSSSVSRSSSSSSNSGSGYTSRNSSGSSGSSYNRPSSTRSSSSSVSRSSSSSMSRSSSSSSGSSSRSSYSSGSSSRSSYSSGSSSRSYGGSSSRSSGSYGGSSSSRSSGSRR